MSGFYRMGKPGEDSLVHLNTGRRSSSGPCCQCPRFEQDNPQWSICGRLTVALCDAPGCDLPMCELHRFKDPFEPNTDWCPSHTGQQTRLELGPHAED